MAHKRERIWRSIRNSPIIGIESVSRSIVAPSDDELIAPADGVIAIGDTEQLKRFIHLL